MSIEDPNFTIITTGGCNAKCDFCTDPMNVKPSPDYLGNLMNFISQVPAKYNQVSISGGEPTISPDLSAVLTIVKFSNKFNKVVLTTNGTKLLENIDLISSTVNHVNISRHAVGYEANVEIFKNKSIINDEDLADACFKLNKKGVDVNLNYVYSADSNVKYSDAAAFVEYAKNIGANSVTFRYDQAENSLAETYLEKMFSDHKKVNEGSCPVCRSHQILVSGIPVIFKASFVEPSKTIGAVYELIYHPSGRLTSDWSGEKDINFKTKVSSPFIQPRQQQAIKHRQIGGGCGSKSPGSC